MNKINNNPTRCLAVFLLLVLVFFDAYSQKISTSPSRLNFMVSPGVTQRAIITVMNNADQKHDFSVDLEISDASRKSIRV